MTTSKRGAFCLNICGLIAPVVWEEVKSGQGKNLMQCLRSSNSQKLVRLH